jgi:predicted enzyme related to lactoylglutathione lyase
MANPFVHVELTTPDPDTAKSFYGSLFGWTLNDVEMGPIGVYTMICTGEGTGGGIMKSPRPDVPTAWLPYVLVDDVRSATDTAISLGATICGDVTEVPNIGWFSIIQDPTGAAIGLWQPKPKE